MEQVKQRKVNVEAAAYTAADALVEELALAGVEVVFGIVSIHNMPIFDAIVRHGGIRIIPARGESGAVNMADGYARVTGKLGVVLTSTGTGAGNAVGSLIEAWCAGTPLLHITGEVASHHIGTGRGYIHEMKDQLMMLEGCSKKAYRVFQAGQTASMARKAIAEALNAPAGPVSLEIPIDLQTTVVHRVHPIATVSASSMTLPEPVVETAADKVAQAKRPVIWAGGGALYSGAAEEVRTLAEMIGAAVITSQSGKGIIPEDHPQCIGHFASYERVKQLIADADLLISVGVRFRGNETSNWKIRVPERHIAIDADPQAINRNYPAELGLVGDAKTVLGQLVQAMRSRFFQADAAYLQEVKEVREAVRRTLRDTLGPYEHFADEIRRILPRDAVLVRDVTVPANVWGSRLIDTYEPRTSIHASGGGIGQGLPTAIGAQAGKPDGVVALIAGDGGFLLNIGELATATQENLPVIVILFDDNGYGVIRNIQQAAYGRQVGVDLVSPDFVAVARGFGFEAERVGSGAEFSAALERAVALRKPYMIVVDMAKVGPMAKPFGGPPGAAEAFRPKADRPIEG